MSEVMTPMSFEQLVDWVLQERKKEEPCSDSIMRTGQMEHITGRCSAYSGDADWTGSRSAYADDTEYCGSLLCRQSFL